MFDMRTFSVALTSEDRGEKNTLSRAVDALVQAGVFDSSHLASFAVVDAGSESLQYIYDAFAEIDRGVYIATGQRSVEANRVFALQLAARLSDKTLGATEPPVVLLLNDDVEGLPLQLLERLAEGLQRWNPPWLMLSAVDAKTYSVGLT